MTTENQTPAGMDSHTLAQLQSVFEVHTSNLTLQSLDAVFEQALCSDEFHDHFEREQAFASWKCIKILITAIQTGKHPKTIKSVKQSIE